MGRSQESFGLGVQEPVAVTRVISLGGGVQSTVLTLLADEGMRSEDYSHEAL